MKKLSIALLFFGSLLFGCNKDSNKPELFEVRYYFNMGGVRSKISYTSIHDNKTITLNDVTTQEVTAGNYAPYYATDFVKVGDHVHLEMSADQNVVGYLITINHIKHLSDGGLIDPVIAHKLVSINSVDLDKTFTEEDFK